MSHTVRRENSPFRINLQQQKKRAKELLAEFNDAGDSALSRFRAFHPQYHNLTLAQKQVARLSDAQLVIAREHGLPSWAKLKQHIAKMDNETQSIQSSKVPPDDQYHTLHIRCGSDIQSTLLSAKFTGDFFEYSDPYCQGPVTDDSHFIERRSNFLFQAYGEFVDKNLSDIKLDLINAYQTLVSAPSNYQRVVLWFEHDSFDQLILARILAYYAEHQRPEIFEMVSINHFPGSIRFIGLGQLPGEAIRLIWQQRKKITALQLELGKQIWEALQDASPQRLYELSQSKDIKHLPHMSNALIRHLQELPSSINGLSLTEQLTLESIQHKPLNAGKVFRELTLKRDPLPWLGDIMYWHILQSMQQCTAEVFSMSAADLNRPWHERTLSITKTGLAVLNGTIHWLSLQPPVRYLGGIKIDPKHNNWTWQEQLMQPVKP